MKGKFITFEGCEGVGKSCQIRLLEQYLKDHNIEYYLTREPGGTEISEQIRSIILDKNNYKMADETEALLYASARTQLVKEFLLPKLKDGKLVFCDRYLDSSFAYQCFARGVDMNFVKSVNAYAIDNCMPDYTVFLCLPPKQAFLRKGGVDTGDRVELSGMDFHEKVYNGYVELSKIYKDRFIVIDASGTKQETHQKIINALKDKGVIK